MAGRESYTERLRRIAKEYEERLTPEQWVQSRLRWEDWEALGKKALEFARQEVRRRKWRGARDGVLPDGYDAESVAAESVRELLSGNCRLAAGFVREKVTRELERLISQRVRSLHRLKEAPAMRSEWELGETLADGERVGVLEGMRSESKDGYETALAREEEERRERLKAEIMEALEPELRRLFECLWSGITKPAEIGRRLRMEEKAVVRARKRLDRRLARLRHAGHAGWAIGESK
jgi:hypothetical protein